MRDLGRVTRECCEELHEKRNTDIQLLNFLPHMDKEILVFCCTKCLTQFNTSNTVFKVNYGNTEYNVLS